MLEERTSIYDADRDAPSVATVEADHDGSLVLEVSYDPEGPIVFKFDGIADVQHFAEWLVTSATARLHFTEASNGQG